jgi:hypothetical protein
MTALYFVNRYTNLVTNRVKNTAASGGAFKDYLS